MHLPDGIVTEPAVLMGSGAVAVAGVTIAYLKCRQSLRERTVAIAGVTTAFIFALQMVNFPIGFGVSGHLMGGALAAILLGPWLGCLVVALVVVPQCLLFNDGGLLSLGINVTSMALVGAFVGGALSAALGKVLPRAAAWFLAAWGSLVVASIVTGLAVMAGSEIGGGAFVKALIGFHLVIGVGEGLITVAVLGALAQLRPDLLTPAVQNGWRWQETLAGLALAVVVVAALSPFASGAPDGLEASLEHGVDQPLAEAAPNLPSPANDYLLLESFTDETLAGILAGLLGVLVCLVIAHAALRPAVPRVSAD
ncbi:PDGLE domain-containing protein [Candidatus Sumerlaeota bacterium]|nr:PDGLE domain-containing protein [Candidatus Sumerlaeota bacterium]